jgi:8-oxo-dGTP pyrophosphatase MutT (NUDIX family)
MSLQKWTLLSTRDASPNKWFPVEIRTYELPNGKIVDDFSVTTLADVAMIVPVTTEGKIVLVQQFKPGFGDVILEFPAGRLGSKHTNIEETAKHELEEETGIKTDSLEYFATVAPFVTKGTEKVFCYLAENIEFNSKQKMDENEDIEVVILSFEELEQLINSNQLQAAVTIAAWELAKKKFSGKFPSWK